LNDGDIVEIDTSIWERCNDRQHIGNWRSSHDCWVADVYFLGVYEAAQFTGPPNSMVNKASGFPTDGAVRLVVHTSFGPVEAACAHGDTGHHNSS